MASSPARPEAPVGRRLVVNADDFGRSEAINAGVLQGHVHGIVTSAGLMVRHPAAAAAAAAAREHPGLGLGLHLDLVEWELLADEWRPAYEVVDTDDAHAVSREAHRQLESFRALVGADPTHLDSHQHVHREEPVRSVAVEIARALAIRCASTGWPATAAPSTGRTAVAGRSGRRSRRRRRRGSCRAFRREPPELACHPATAAEPFTSYSAERPLELAALCDAGVRRALHEAGIELRSFGQL